ncbi:MULTISPECIES: hypothetical protein [Nocardia]|uniref:hypothetical protein n=1 Tax=Nocardia TaxID=1817 RepID=UPI000D68F27A|nr:MULTISPECIES: hypothetical protein [Nocardia]
MRRNTIRATMLVLAGATVVAVLPGSASAAVLDSDPVGGRERVKVTVTSDKGFPEPCNVYVDGGPLPRGTISLLPGHRQSLVIGQVAPGWREITVACSASLPVTRPVEVGLANPALDAVDSMLIGTGSSSMATDPTLR